MCVKHLLSPVLIPRRSQSSGTGSVETQGPGRRRAGQEEGAGAAGKALRAGAGRTCGCSQRARGCSRLSCQDLTSPALSQ